MADQKNVEFIDHAFAPEMFADAALHFALASGVVRITLASNRFVNRENRMVIVGRIAMPVAGAQGLVVGLNGFLSKSGFNPSDAASKGQTPQ